MKIENEKKTDSQTYAYCRISSKTQHVNRQTDFFHNFDIPDNNIYVDKASGKSFNRPAYKRLYRKLKSGDTLYVKELDRFGRNKDEIKTELEKLNNKKVTVRILNIPTTMIDYKDSVWLGEMINNIMIEVLSSMAEQERITMKQRQAEGIAAAKARGVRFGRPPVQLPDNFGYYYNAWRSKSLPVQQILNELNVDYIKFKTFARSYSRYNS